MPIRDLLKHKHPNGNVTPPARLENPQVVISQSDTNAEEVLTATTTQQQQAGQDSGANNGAGQLPPLLQRANSTSGVLSLSAPSSQTNLKVLPRSSSTRLISERFSMRRTVSSSHVPEDLPEITITDDAEGNGAEWERRATMLAWENEKSRSRSTSPAAGATRDAHQVRPRPASATFELGAPAHSPPPPPAGSSPDADINIQEAIRLHEAGDLERSTKMFGQLADPSGQNDALSQVLYGLALRHGWGCLPNPSEAIIYLSAAASNAASIEKLALQAGMKKGGAAKGELILAIFELANCFRHGWGVEMDPVAAQRYYETAANLGDTDAMNEAAWCYLEGFGCKKDRFAAAKYYRLAEEAGSKTLGNSWIWKDKYTPGHVDSKTARRAGKHEEKERKKREKEDAKGIKEQERRDKKDREKEAKERQAVK